MAKYGSSSVTIAYDDSSGTARTITQYVTEIGGISVESMQADTASFGDSWGESTPTGFNAVDDVAIKGFYDDTATSGPHVVFNTVGAATPASTSRTLTVDFGGTNGQFDIETRLKKYTVLGKNKGLTEYEAIVTATGSGAWS